LQLSTVHKGCLMTTPVTGTISFNPDHFGLGLGLGFVI
jgi:hypothetical protein